MTPDPAAPSASYEAIDAYVASEMRRLKMPGVALAIVAGDRMVHLRGFGQARPGGAAPTPQTPFFIGSLAKSITAVAVMQLVEAGRLELDAPVQRYLPWFRVADPQASAAITVRHLLHQTSGLSGLAGEISLADFDARPDACERQARALSTLRLERPVGSAFEYSNANYNLLGLIIAAVSGMAYADYIQAHILRPLGMRRTAMSPDTARQDGLAVGHQYWFGYPVAAPDLPVAHGSLPSGQLISSAEDLARYLIAHLNGGRCGDAQILSAAGIAELQRGAAVYQVFGLTLHYAMGWFDDRLGASRLVWHGGTMPHFGSYMALLPDQKLGVVLLFNADHHWFNPVVAEFGTAVVALLTGEPHKPLPLVARIPWILRGQLLVPILQLVGAAATLGLLRRWRRDPALRPTGARARGLHLLLPLLASLPAVLNLRSVLGRRRGYLKYYMPDYYWLSLVSGGGALLWSLLRTGLVLNALRRPSTATTPRPSGK